MRFLDTTGALYLDTQESRGLVPADHPSSAAAVRAAAMTDADVVLLIGRKGGGLADCAAKGVKERPGAD